MEYYQEIQNRTAQTVAVLRAHAPALKINGRGATELAAAGVALDGRAQARENPLVAFDDATRAEFSGFQEIRLLALRVPALIEAQLGDEHPAADSLDKVFAITPRTTELAVQRARALLPVWAEANAALAAQTPPQPTLTRNGLGLASLETDLAGQPALEQNVENAAAGVNTARNDLLRDARALDRLNKRFYKALKAQADPGTPLADALGQITTETPDLPETLGIRSVLQGGEDGLHVLVGYENGTGDGATERSIEWRIGGDALSLPEEFAFSAPADPSGNALGPFAAGDTVRLCTRVRNANGTRTGSVRTVTITAPVA